MTAFKIGEMVGFRYWIYSGKSRLLFSPYSYSEWKPGVTQVMRDLSQDKIARKALNGHAGIYSVKTREVIDEFLSKPTPLAYLRKLWWGLDHCYEPLGVVVGSVKMWGSVVQCKDGYRSQYASINSIDAFIDGPELTDRVDLAGWHPELSNKVRGWGMLFDIHRQYIDDVCQ
jgi:hypothetical protein